jgi:hypothetical protein
MLEELLGKGTYNFIMYPLSKFDLQDIDNTVSVFKEDLGANIVIVFGNMNLIAPVVDAFLRNNVEVWFSKTDLIHIEENYGKNCLLFDKERDVFVQDGRKFAHKRFSGYFLVTKIITLNGLSRLALDDIENSKYVKKKASTMHQQINDEWKKVEAVLDEFYRHVLSAQGCLEMPILSKDLHMLFT